MLPLGGVGEGLGRVCMRDFSMTVAVPATTRCGSIEAFWAMKAATAREEADSHRFEAALLGAETFAFPGLCAVCGRAADLMVDHLCCHFGPDGSRTPNWRERLVCPRCGLVSRQRAAVSFVLSLSAPGDSIYLTEQATPCAAAVRARRPNAVGSEYLSDGTKRGATNAQGVRHEDARRLTFRDRCFDMVATFDVLEHVPDHRLALGELSRVLKPGGRLVMTVPFAFHLHETVQRAIVEASGEVRHLLPPEIHGDPFRPEGALCFQNFGWDLLTHLFEAGFEDAALHFYWSPELGYLGAHQFVILARKARAPLRRPSLSARRPWLGWGLFRAMRQLVGSDPAPGPPRH